MILKKLENVNDRYREIEQMLTLSSVIADNKEYMKLMKEYKNLSPIVDKYREYKQVESELFDSDEMIRDVRLSPSSFTRSYAFCLCRETRTIPRT